MIIRGAGGKAFCAGGDIRGKQSVGFFYSGIRNDFCSNGITALVFVFSCSEVTEAGKAGGSLAQDFFREEYTLNYTIGLSSIFRFVSCVDIVL